MNGSFVHISEFEPATTIEPKPMNGDVSLRHVRPDRTERNPKLLPVNPFTITMHLQL